MSRQLDLRSGRPVWFAYRAPSVRAASLTRDVTCDVAVVGLGISGAMIIQSLARAGHKVIGIDRRGPMLGSTPATTALVQYEIDQPLTALARMVGADKARQAWRRSRLAVTNLADRIEQIGIRCDMTRRPSIYLAGNEMGPGDLRDEAAARRAAGLGATYLTKSELADAYGLDRNAAIVSEGNLALNPRKLTSGLFNDAIQAGARLYAPTEAVSIETDAAGVSISTADDGPVIRAAHVVLATGYELVAPITARGHRIVSTWAIATKPQPRALWPREAFIWEASEPYLYMRATSDGRVICGGEDEDFQDEEKRDALIAEKSRIISRKLSKLLPAIDATPEFSWAGAFGTTATGLPIIDQVPRKPRIIAVMGYGGNGITYSQIASELVATTLGGGQDSDAALYAFPAATA